MKFTIHLENRLEDFLYGYSIDSGIDILQWFAGIILGILLTSFVRRWFQTNIQIDPKLHHRYMFHVERTDGKKWLIINPATPWHMLEAIYLYLYWKIKGKPKKEREESDSRRVRILRRIWLSIASFILILGTFSTFFLCVEAEGGQQQEVFPYLVKIQMPDQPKPSEFASEEPKQEDPKTKPQTSYGNQELKIQQIETPKPQPVEKHMDQPRLENKLHKINKKLDRINNRLHEINEKLDTIKQSIPNNNLYLPNTNNINLKLDRSLDKLNVTLEEVQKTIEEVKEIQNQIPTLTNETIAKVTNLPLFPR